jgi:hypothetical protein
VTAGPVAATRLALPTEADPVSIVVARYADKALTRREGDLVPCQLDGDELTFLTGGGRHFAAYFSRRGVQRPSQDRKGVVAVDEGVPHQGQDSIKVRSTAAEWIYHAEGAGFASLIDREGNDWISYRPGNRASGEFRGIPNLGAFAHPGYTGTKGSRTTIERRGTVTVRLRSESNDGKGALVWDIYPGFARLTVERTGEPFWVLYEGTPAGGLDLETGYWGTADGVRRPLTETWNRDLAGLEWVYFGDTSVRRALYLLSHQDDSFNDQFYQMDGAMTVWGFGRQHRCCGKYLHAPAQFTVGVVESQREGGPRFEEIRKEVEVVAMISSVQTGTVEWKQRR